MEYNSASSTTDLLAREVLRDVQRSWDRFKEPLKLRQLSKYATRFKKIGSSVTDFCWSMHEQGLIRMAENVNAQLFIYPAEVYKSMSLAERTQLDEGFGPGMPEQIYSVGRPKGMTKEVLAQAPVAQAFEPPAGPVVSTPAMDALKERMKQSLNGEKASTDAEGV
jgi:hypothetical protein